MEAVKASYNNPIWSVSDPILAQKKAKEYLGKNAILYISNRKDKKYMILDPNTNKMVHFGALGMEDFTKHKSLERRRLYIARASNIKGNWKNNKYSPNNLSLRILWD